MSEALKDEVRRLSEAMRSLRKERDDALRQLQEKTLALENAQLRAENAALKGGRGKGLRFEVGQKGGVVVKGLQKFPTTLYKDQWITLLDAGQEIRAFIAANEHKLKQKPGDDDDGGSKPLPFVERRRR